MIWAVQLKKDREMKKNRILGDSIALAAVKIFTMVTSIVSTMILSRALPLTEYGTYSTGNLICNTATLLSAFGLIDAVNYYYNGKKTEERNRYINTVFLLFLICGGIAGIAILYGKNFLTEYFHNPALGGICAYIAFRPLALNMGQGLQNLQVSIGKARLCALRNGMISSVKVIAIIITAVTSKDIRIVFFCLLMVETVSDVMFYIVLKNNGVTISPFHADFSKIKEILAFCIPMGIYIQTNSLSRDLDKYVIGFFESTDKLAIYTNCSTKLPFDVVSGPLLTLLIPLLTTCIKNDDYKNGSQLFKCYIKIGYIFTFAFGIGCILVASQAVEFLYGSKYLEGVPLFIIYVIVDMINFISYSLALAAKGRTKELMKVSCVALALNTVINLLMYKTLGFLGPALATVIVTFGVSFCLLSKSANIVHESLISLIDWRHLGRYAIESVFLCLVSLIVKHFMEKASVHYLLILMISGGLFVGSILALNIKDIKKCFSLLNEINKSEQEEAMR